MDSKYIRQFKKGALEMVLLYLVSQGETYGYQILSYLNTKGAVLGYAREGTIYPILYRLEDTGLIKSRIGPPTASGGAKKYYSITPEGRDVLQQLVNFWGEYKNCIDELIGKKRKGGGQNEG